MPRNVDLPAPRSSRKEREKTEKALTEKPKTAFSRLLKKVFSGEARRETKKLKENLRETKGWKNETTKKLPTNIQEEIRVRGVTAKKWTPEASFLSQLGPAPVKEITLEDINDAEVKFENKYGIHGWALDPVSDKDGKELPLFFLNGEPRNGIMIDKNGKPQLRYTDGKGERIQ